MFQLSQKYKSSADLVSELLKKPVFTRYRSIKKKSFIPPAVQTCDKKTNQSDLLHSVDLVKSAASKAGDNNNVEVTTVQMRFPVTMRPRLATVSSDSGSSDEVDSSPGEVTNNTRGAVTNIINTNKTTGSSDEVDPSSGGLNNKTGGSVCVNNMINTSNSVVTNNTNNKTNISDKSTSTTTVRETLALLSSNIDLSDLIQQLIILESTLCFHFQQTPAVFNNSTQI